MSYDILWPASLATRTRRTIGTLALVLASVCLAGCNAAFPIPARSEAASTERIAVVGASLSAGACAHSLASKLRDVRPAGTVVLDASDMLFLFDPEERGREAVDEALAFSPDWVLALDFLFWFAYRRHDVSAGLRELGRLDTRIVVGDIPAMDQAPSWIGLDLSAHELHAFNDLIARWAASRPNVILVPLSAWSREARAGLPPRRPGGIGVRPDQLFFIDRIHPSDEGADLILDRVLRAL